MSNKLIVEGNALRNGAYRFTDAGAVEIIDAKGSWKAVESKNIKGPLESLLREAKSAPASLNQGARGWLEANLAKINLDAAYPSATPAEQAIKKAATDSMSHIKDAVEFAENQHANPTVDALRAGILKHGEFAEKLLSPETIEAAEKAGFKLADMAALRADGDALKALLKVEGANPIAIDKVKDLLMKNHGSADQLVAAIGGSADAHLLANHGGGLAEIAAGVKAQVVAAENALRPTVESIKTAAEGLEYAKKTYAGDVQIIAAAEKEFKAATDAAAKLLGKQEGQEALKLLHADETFKETLEAARKASPELEKSAKTVAAQVANAAKGASETAWGWSKKVGPKAEGITGALWKNRGVAGKGALIAGVAAVGYAIVSAIGGKGPGENAEKVRNQQAEPAMGR